MSIVLPFLALLLAGAFVAYHRMRLVTWTLISVALLVACWFIPYVNQTATIVAAAVLAVIAVPLLLPFIRKPLLTGPMMKVFRKVLPPLSQTERIALETGSVGFEGELFTGDPDWNILLNYPKPQLTAEEQAFLDGPVEELCAMVNDWEITHVHADLPPELWAFIKKNKFFGMIIPKEYGGLGFSALAHHKVIQKLASVSSVVSSTVGVPNSLGPGELLVHYGTQEQKDQYLPRLADGREVPCFGLTGPFAYSDATSIPDYGIVCRGEWNGEQVLGVKLTFDKRYITLAPVASLIGLAFRMYDPDGLIGDTRDIGITLGLLPRDTAGCRDRPSPLPAELDVPERPDPRQGRVHSADPADRWRGHGLQGLEHAQRVPGRGPLDHPAVHRQWWCQGRCCGHRRLCPHPQAVRPVGRPLRGR